MILKIYSDKKLKEMYYPSELTDFGEVNLFKRYMDGKIVYSSAKGFMTYEGQKWDDDESKVHNYYEQFTAEQLQYVRDSKKEITEALDSQICRTEEERLKTELDKILALENFVKKHRNHSGIMNVIEETKHKVSMNPNAFDANGFLLNTPDGTYDLRLGLAGKKEHDPADYCTRITRCAPDNTGKELWDDFLNTVFLNDDKLIAYVQMVSGSMIIGKVFQEALIIAYGSGRNGKSTFWDTIARVLGGYSGNISADALTANCRRNIKPEMAELCGKRLVIAAELSDGVRFDDGVLKQICSTGDIFAEKKFKSPFSFAPSHSVVLYTNHLPKVSSTDDGTWRRFIIIPFNAKITGSSEVKNYGDYLLNNAGGAILSWLIEGAQKAIAANFKFPLPKCVEDCIDSYKEANDWFGNFFSECCVVDNGVSVASGKLYEVYRNYSQANNEYVRSTTDFYAELEKRGFNRYVEHNKRFVKGLRFVNQ